MLTIQKLVDQNKIVLDVLLSDLTKVGVHYKNHLVEELKHHRSVHILLRDGRQPHVVSLYVKETCPRHVCYRRSNWLARMNYLHAECVDCIASKIIRPN